MEIEDQADAVASAQRHCREGEPVWNAIRVNHINRALAVNLEQGGGAVGPGLLKASQDHIG